MDDSRRTENRLFPESRVCDCQGVRGYQVCVCARACAPASRGGKERGTAAVTSVINHSRSCRRDLFGFLLANRRSLGELRRRNSPANGPSTATMRCGFFLETPRLFRSTHPRDKTSRYFEGDTAAVPNCPRSGNSL